MLTRLATSALSPMSSKSRYDLKDLRNGETKTKNKIYKNYMFLFIPVLQKNDNEMVQAEHVRNSLLEITRNTSRGWHDDQMATGSMQNEKNEVEYQHYDDHQHHSGHHHPFDHQMNQSAHHHHHHQHINHYQNQ